MLRIARYLPLLFILALNFSGCQNDKPKLTVEDPRAELSPVMRREGMVYLTIVNTGGKDTLIGVKTNIPGATADIHQMRGNLMVLTKTMVIPAKSIVDLQPMASHIMLENLPAEAKEGDPLILTLVFEKSGEMSFPLVLSNAQAMPMMHEHGETQEHDHEHRAH